MYGISNPRCLQLPPPKALTLQTHLHLQFSPMGLSLPSLMEELATLLLSWLWKLPLNSFKETHPRLQKGIFQPWEGFQSTDKAQPRIMYTWAHTDLLGKFLFSNSILNQETQQKNPPFWSLCVSPFTSHLPSPFVPFPPHRSSWHSYHSG